MTRYMGGEENDIPYLFTLGYCRYTTDERNVAKMRTALRNKSEVYHVYAQNRQEEGRCGNCSFIGDSAYSYDAVIGKRIRNDAGEIAYLLTSNRWSRTTSRHQSDLSRALRGQMVFTTSLTFSRWREPAPTLVLTRMLEDIAEQYSKAQRQRQRKYWSFLGIQNSIENAQEFALFAGITIDPALLSPYANLDAEIESVLSSVPAERKTLSDEEREAKREKELQSWLQGKRQKFPSIGNRFQYLRVYPADPSQVQTSLGAIVPLCEVQKIAPLILRLVDRGEGADLAGHGFKLGYYQVDRVTKEGVVKVGCHWFAREEIKRFAGIILPIG